MRYQFTPTNLRYDKSKVYKTTYYPNIPLDPNDIYITSNDGDYLDSLAKKYYGDESYWWIIATANDLGKGKLSLPPGLQLRIPGNVQSIIQGLKSVN